MFELDLYAETLGDEFEDELAQDDDAVGNDNGEVDLYQDVFATTPTRTRSSLFPIYATSLSPTYESRVANSPMPQDPQLRAIEAGRVNIGLNTSTSSVTAEVDNWAQRAVVEHQPLPVQAFGFSSSLHGSKTNFAVYVGNLTWWTSDADLDKVIRQVGIEDVTDIKFEANYINGQSKGLVLEMFGVFACARVACFRLFH